MVTSRMTPQYVATAQLMFGPRSVSEGDLNAAMQELNFSGEFVASYAVVLTSHTLAEHVLESTGVDVRAESLVERTETNILPETRIIEVSVTDSSPARAQLLANALVNEFVEDDENKFGVAGGVEASVIEPARRPSEPVAPKPFRNGILGGILGLALGVGMTFLLEQLDTTLKNREDVAKALAPLPVLAVIPFSPETKSREIFIETAPKSPQAEALRILRTNVHFMGVDKPIRRVLITSPYAEDGKTTVATNLAATMAAAGSTTILIETDLRKPVLEEFLELGVGPGLSEVLAGQSDLKSSVRETRFPNLRVLAAGAIPPNPSELLGSQRMQRLLHEVAKMADVIVLDTPPALPVTDAAVLAPHTDGVVLVTRAGRTHSNRAKEAKEIFERLGVRVLGSVLNGMQREEGQGGYYYYRYYHEPRAETPSNGRSRGKRKQKPTPQRPPLEGLPVAKSPVPSSPPPRAEDSPVASLTGAESVAVPAEGNVGQVQTGAPTGHSPGQQLPESSLSVPTIVPEVESVSSRLAEAVERARTEYQKLTPNENASLADSERIEESKDAAIGDADDDFHEFWTPSRSSR